MCVSVSRRAGRRVDCSDDGGWRRSAPTTTARRAFLDDRRTAAYRAPPVPEPRAIAPGLFVADADEPRLVGATCQVCDKPHFPRGPVCPYCAADACVDTRFGPSGRLSLFTVVTNRPPGYRGPVPYGFGVVELPGGLLVISRLTEHRLDHLHPGLSVRLVIEPLFTDEDEHPVLAWAFRPEAP
jgi:uncharacterized protein